MQLPQVYQTLVKIPVIEYFTYIFVLKHLIDNFARTKIAQDTTQADTPPVSPKHPLTAAAAF